MASGTNVGNLNATLSLSAFEFNAGLKQSEEAAKQFATTTEVSSQRASTAMMKAGRAGGGVNTGGIAQAVQSVGFGLQDFTSQLGTRGLAGAIPAAANNVQMLGAMFGPVGLAATAVGGALAGILLPRLIETGSIFGKTAEEAKAFSDKVAKSADDAFRPWREAEMEKFDALRGTEEQLDSRIERIKEKTSLLIEEQVALLTARQNSINAGNIDEANAFAGEANKKRDQIIADQKRMAELEGSRGAVAAANDQRNAAKLEEKNRKDNEEYTLKSIENVEKFRLDSLEKYGTESQKTEAKIARERREAESRFGLSSGASEAMKQFDKNADAQRQKARENGADMSQLEARLAREREAERSKLGGVTGSEDAMRQFEKDAEVERQKARVKDAESALSEMGSAAGGSAGASRSSSAGVEAINRATSGTASLQSVAKESLKVQRDQLKELERLARPVMVSLSG